MSFASTLNRRVTILRPAIGTDSVGQPATGFDTLRQAWASIQALGGVEFIKAGAQASQTKASIRLRYCTDIDAGMRVQYGATVYAITAVLSDEQSKRHVDLVCEATK